MLAKLRSNKGFGLIDSVVTILLVGLAVYIAMNTMFFSTKKQDEISRKFAYNNKVNEEIKALYEKDWRRDIEDITFSIKDSNYKISYKKTLERDVGLNKVNVRLTDENGEVLDDFDLEKTNMKGRL